MLLIRGRLLQRFPNALIYAAKAAWSKDDAGQPVTPRHPVRPGSDLASSGYIQPLDLPLDGKHPERYPIFHGMLPPDLTFLGFDLPPDEMRGDQDPAQNKPGWFVILQQQPTQPRYGLDETRPTQPTGTWEDLSWEDIDLSSSPYMSPARALKSGAPAPTKAPDKDISWGADLTSAQLASMTLQTPVRVAIHASDLLPSL